MRVRSNSESQKLANEGRGSLVPVFKYEPGWTYNLIPLTDSNGDQVMYQEHVHSLNFSRNGKTNFDRVRCVKGYVDETKDPLDTSRQKNSGNCMYCDIAFKANKVAKAEKEAWEKENPNASKEDKDAAFMKINSKKAVSMFDTERYYLCAHLEADKLGKIYTMDENGVPLAKLVLVKVGQSQYDNKLTPVINDIKDITESDKLDYCHIRFIYGEGNKMAAAKNMTISISPKGAFKIYETYPELREKLEGMVANLEKVPDVAGATEDDAPINKLDEKLFSFMPESELKIEKQLAAVSARYSDDLSDEEKEELAKEIEANGMETQEVSPEDLAKKFNMDVEDNESEGGFNPEA